MRGNWTPPDYAYDLDPNHPWYGDVQTACMAMPYHGTEVWDSSPHRRHGVAGSAMTFIDTDYGKAWSFNNGINDTITWGGLSLGTVCPDGYTVLLLMKCTDTVSDWWHTGDGNRMLWRYSSSKLNLYSNLVLEMAASLTLPTEVTAWALTHDRATTRARFYQDGDQILENTSVVYATGTSEIALGDSTASSRDLLAEMYQYVLINRELRAEEVMEWAQDPWAMFREEEETVGFVPAAPPASTNTNQLMLMGAGT